MVKNEEDIIELFCRYTLAYCDKMLIIDDDSDDNTPSIIQSLVEEGLQIVLIKKEFSLGFYKFERINELAMLSFEQYEADLVIPIDADEFITTDQNYSVRQILEGLPDDIIYKFRWRTYVLTEEAIQKKGELFDRIEKYRPIELEKMTKIVISRRLLIDDGYIITLGQHHLLPSQGSPSRETIVSDSLVFAHFPIRSIAQINTKIIVGWINYQCMPEDRAKSWHWPIMYESIKNCGGLSIKQAEKYSVFYSYFDDRTEINESNFHSKLTTNHIDLKHVLQADALPLKFTPPPEENEIKIGLILSHIEKMIKAFESEKSNMTKDFEIEKSKLVENFKTEKDKEIALTIDELKASNSWKVGRFVTSPVRILRQFVFRSLNS